MSYSNKSNHPFLNFKYLTFTAGTILCFSFYCHSFSIGSRSNINPNHRFVFSNRNKPVRKPHLRSNEDYDCDRRWIQMCSRCSTSLCSHNLKEDGDVTGGGENDDRSQGANSMIAKAKALRREASLAETELRASKDAKIVQKNRSARTFIDEIRSLVDFNSGGVGSGKSEDGVDDTSSSSTLVAFKEITEREEVQYKQTVYEYLHNLNKLPSLDLLVNVLELLFEQRQESLKKYRECEKELASSNDGAAKNPTNKFNIGDLFNQKENRIEWANSKLVPYQTEAMQCALLWEFIVSGMERIAKEDEKAFGTSLDKSLFRVDEKDSNVNVYRSQRPGMDVASITRELRTRERELTMQFMADATRRVFMSMSNDDAASSSSTNNPMTTRDDANSDSSYERYMRETYGLDTNIPNQSRSAEFNVTQEALLDYIALPYWVPRSLGAIGVTSGEALLKNDLATVQDVLTNSSFFVTSRDATKLFAIFRGNILQEREMRKHHNNSTSMDTDTRLISEQTFKNIQQNLRKCPNLSDRVQLFLVEDYYDPSSKTGLPGVFSRNTISPQKAIIVTSSSVKPDQGDKREVIEQVIVVLSTLAAILFTISYGVVCYALNEQMFQSTINDERLTFVGDIFSIAGGIGGLQLIHEFAHWIVAKTKNIRTGLPILLPSAQLGIFGCITPLRSFPDSRTCLFDFSAAGPCLTFIVSIALYIFGLIQTVGATTEALATFPVLPAVLFKSSFLIGTLSTTIAPKIMMLPPAQPVPIHPLCCIAQIGLYTSALNLLPLGRTDGGRLSTSVFGPKSAALLSNVVFALMCVICLTKKSVLLIFWGLLSLIWQRSPEIPTRDSVTDVNDSRILLYVAVIVVSMLTLLPFPGGSAL